ncbi:MAG: CRISPR-associated endonuclease Cas1 [Saprospiraceae bacterium]
MQIFLQSFGTKLRAREGLLEVTTINDEEGIKKQQFPPHEVEGIWMEKQTSVTSDAIMLATQNNVPIIIVNHFGFPVGRFISSKATNTSLIQKNQIRASIDQHGIGFVKKWLTEKLSRQSRLIGDLAKKRKGEDIQQLCKDCMDKLTEIMEQIKVLEGNDVQEISGTLRGLEGTAGRMYWATISQLLPENYRFETRSRRPAKDAFNAYLNYAYGVLYARVELELYNAGLNPHIGFMHRDGHQYKGMIYDFIEPYREWMERVVFFLFSGKKVGKKQFKQEKNGGITIMNPGKKVLIYEINEFFRHRKEKFRGKICHPDYILRSRAKGFAQTLRQIYVPVMEKDEAL